MIQFHSHSSTPSPSTTCKPSSTGNTPAQTIAHSQIRTTWNAGLVLVLISLFVFIPFTTWGQTANTAPTTNPEEIRQFLDTLELTDEERDFLQQFYEMKGLPATPSIVGGNDADIADYPWQVALTTSSGFQFCGGSVVDAEWILTAAHCLGGSLPFIRAGVTNINDNSGQDIATVQQFLHPGFISVTSGDDIALLKLAQPLDLTDPNVAVIPIATQAHRDAGFEDPGVMSSITGWGALSSGGPSPDILQVVEAPIVSNEQAQTGYPTETITDDMIAAGVWGVGGKDACQGDSGGPLAVPFEGSPIGYIIAGITSWGYGCANPTEMGMYARVSYFQQWLEETSGLSWPGPDGYPAAIIPEVTFDVTMLTNETASQSFSLESVGNYGLNYSLSQYYEPLNILEIPGFETLQIENTIKSQKRTSAEEAGLSERHSIGESKPWSAPAKPTAPSLAGTTPSSFTTASQPSETQNSAFRHSLTAGTLADSAFVYDFNDFTASGGQFIPVAESGFEGVITEVTGNFVLNASSNSTWASDFAVVVTNSDTFSPANAILQVGGYNDISQNKYEWGSGDSGTPGTSIQVTITLDQPVSGGNLHIWIGNGWTNGGSLGTWSGSISIPGVEEVPNLITDITPSSGRIEPGFSEEITVAFSSVDFEPGVYQRMLLLQTNDPDQQQTFFPVTVTVLDENGSLSDFESVLTITDKDDNETTLAFGTAPNATNGFDDQYDQVAPAPPVPGELDARFQINGSDYLTFYQRSTEIRTEWPLKISAPESAYPITITWDPSSLTEPGFFRIYGAQNGLMKSSGMKNNGILILDSPADADLMLEHVVQKNYELNYAENWNLIALPVETVHDRFTDLFPTAYPNALFSFNGNYQMESVLQMERGYWIRLTESWQQTFSGVLPDHNPVQLRSGWNLIAAYSFCEPYCEIEDSNSIISEGSVFEFDGGYAQTSQLLSGRGYWARTSSEGSVQLVPGSPASAAPSALSGFSDLLARVDDEAVRLEFEQDGRALQPLFMAYEGDGFEKDAYAFSLPPVPPAASPDVRFSGHNYVSSGSSVSLLIQQQHGTPLFLELEEGHEALMQLWSTDELLWSGQLTGGKAMELPKEATSASLQLMNHEEKNEIPESFTLAQNYPNPFNPATQIGYSLPQDADVEIGVYTMLGQRVATLQKGLQKAGSYSVSFDASSLSSGVYLYRITAYGGDEQNRPFQAIRKMTLLK